MQPFMVPFSEYTTLTFCLTLGVHSGQIGGPELVERGNIISAAKFGYIGRPWSLLVVARNRFFRRQSKLSTCIRRKPHSVVKKKESSEIGGGQMPAKVSREKQLRGTSISIGESSASSGILPS